MRAGSDMDAVNADLNTAAHLAFKFGRSELGECVPSPPSLFTPPAVAFVFGAFFSPVSQVLAHERCKR